MNPEDCKYDGAALPAPVWDDTKFKAGRLSRICHRRFWEEVILVDHPQKDYLLQNMEGLDPARYFRRFTGRFAGKSYDSDTPPHRIFRNNWPDGLTSTGEKPEDWALKQILQDCETGAVRCLGKVGEVPPPRVVLPLTVELDKPRLIHNARYLNLWNATVPFTMGRVASIPETIPRGSFMTSLDHKSGYHAFRFKEEAMGWFGMCIGGYYFVPAAGVFGWNRLPEIYHIAHEALMSFAAKVFGIPSLTYLDDNFSGSMWRALHNEGSMQATARWGVRVQLWLSFLAGYTISIKKSVIEPVRELVWLGITINSLRCDFSIPEGKKESFLKMVTSSLRSGSITIRDMEKIAGKGISFVVAIGEAAMLYTREIFNCLSAVRSGKMASSSGIVKLSRRLRHVFEVWIKFLDLFDGSPWMRTEHETLRIETDASSRRWGGVWKEGGATSLEVGEEFNKEELALHIEAKEAIAVTKVLLGIAEVKGWKFFEGKRFDAWIDNLPLVFALAKGSSQMKEVHDELEKLFWMKIRYKFTIHAYWWDTHANAEADAVTRTDEKDDWCLSNIIFLMLWDKYGPFEIDLMASSVNVQKGPDGKPMKFFSRFWSPGTAGVNVLAQKLGTGTYFCFAPKKMLVPVINHLSSSGVNMKVVLIAESACSLWQARVSTSICSETKLLEGSVYRHDGSNIRGSKRGFSAYCIQF